MSGLVGYGSSDEEDDVQPERPAKIARIEARGTDISTSAVQGTHTKLANAPPVAQPPVSLEPPPEESIAQERAPGPSLQSQRELSTTNTPASAALSPYSTERQRIQELTMPAVPNFDFPDSPPPPSANSEDAATLAVTTKKFERFLELKKQGVHFNDRLQKSAALRNPSLLPKLMQFAGISLQESYASTLSTEIAVPTSWPEDCYVESLMKANERKERKRMEARDKIDFVSSRSGASRGSSAAGTPKESSTSSNAGPKRSKFDRH